MNNEPIAWIKQGRLGYPVLEFDKPFRYENYAIHNPPIPFYTNPVKEHFEDEPQAEELHEILQSNLELTLTDEEIWEVIDNCFGIDAFNFDSQISLGEARDNAFELVKAILRKKQER